MRFKKLMTVAVLTMSLVMTSMTVCAAEAEPAETNLDVEADKQDEGEIKKDSQEENLEEQGKEEQENKEQEKTSTEENLP